FKVDDFYAARSRTIPPLPWSNIAPPFSAEVTGRSKRLVRDGSGQQRLESRSPRTNLAETTAFMTGAKRILVFSDAGG
ncbi:strawberry notch C-terminal domain-containing protein, partial [Acinetobacter baumannii]